MENVLAVPFQSFVVRLEIPYLQKDVLVRLQNEARIQDSWRAGRQLARSFERGPKSRRRWGRNWLYVKRALGLADVTSWARDTWSMGGRREIKYMSLLDIWVGRLTCITPHAILQLYAVTVLFNSAIKNFCVIFMRSFLQRPIDGSSPDQNTYSCLKTASIDCMVDNRPICAPSCRAKPYDKAAVRTPQIFLLKKLNKIVLIDSMTITCMCLSHALCASPMNFGHIALPCWHYPPCKIRRRSVNLEEAENGF